MANSAAVQLAVQILGDNGHLQNTLNQSTGQVNSFSSNVVKASAAAAAGFAAISAAGASAVYTVHTIAIENAMLARELSRMSAAAHESVTGIQRAEAATRGLGFEQGKMADILKDFQDKLGDFAVNGGGEFADFFEKVAPKVGLTTKKLQEMAGVDALIAVKKAMDDVNVSASEQIFFLESIANDASALTPLLEDNGRAFKDLSDDYVAMNSVMTDSELELYKGYAKDVDALGGSFDALVRETLNPYIDKLGGASRAMAELFSQWRVNVVNQGLQENYLNKDQLEEDIKYVEYVHQRFPKSLTAGLTGIEKGILRSEGKINNRVVAYSKAQLDRYKEQLKRVRADLGEQLEHAAQLQGKPGDTPSGKSTGVNLNAPDEKGSSSSRASANPTLGLIDRYDLQYANETEKLELQHLARLEKIRVFELTATELKRQGFESNAQLREGYTQREDDYYNQELEKIKEREQLKAQNDLDRMMQSQATLQESEIEAHRARNEVLSNALEAGVITREKFHALVERAEDKHQLKMSGIQAKERADQLKNYGDLFGGIAGIMKTAAGEQSGIYKAMFLASKAFALAESIIKIQQGIAQAASLPFPANIPAIGSVISATAGVISTISGTGLDGMAHDGIDYIPREGTWLLNKGERVLSPKQNALFSNLEKGGSLGGGLVQLTQHFYMDKGGHSATEESGGGEEYAAFAERMADVARRTINEEQQPGGMLEAG